MCFQEKKCRYLTKEISRILQVIDSHRNDPLKVANSDHVVKITEVNYFDARSDNIEADDTNENQTPMTIAGNNWLILGYYSIHLEEYLLFS